MVLSMGTGYLNLTCMGWETVNFADQIHTVVDTGTAVQGLVATYLELSVDP